MPIVDPQHASFRFPGAEIVEPGLRDLEAGAVSVAAAAVAMAATRLRDSSAGVAPAGPETGSANPV